jgi:2-oxoglutarate ferredoxin oxidoreductase subunit alpha
MGWRAFNLAEKYQCPVIILSDLFLSSQLRSVDKNHFDFKAIKIDRGALLSEKELDKITDYKRHQFTANGISPRAVPGHRNSVYVTTSDEHSEYGYAVEDETARNKMMEKRMKKYETMMVDIKGPELYGDKDADYTLVCWGSTYGAIREAVDIMKKKGVKVNMLKFTDIWPFPVDKAMPFLKNAKHLISIENNYTSQLAGVIRRCTGIDMKTKITKYSGRPFSPAEIIAHLKKEAKVNV